MATPAKIVAERVQGDDKPPTDEVRQLLGVSATDPVRYRHVRLHCGEHVLSEADNWYVPSRLSAEMNQQLETSDTPFGKVVQALHFRRQTLSAQLLWSPLPEGWESKPTLPPASNTSLVMPPHVLEHRALLFDQANRPFSLVVETYTSQVIAFVPPAPLRP